MKPCKYIIDIHSNIVTNHFIDEEFIGIKNKYHWVEDQIICDYIFDCGIIYRYNWTTNELTLTTYE
jgi:hypothetical protein